MSPVIGRSQRIHAGLYGANDRPPCPPHGGISQRIYTSTTGGPFPTLSGIMGLAQRIRAPMSGGCFDRTVWGGPGGFYDSCSMRYVSYTFETADLPLDLGLELWDQNTVPESGFSVLEAFTKDGSTLTWDQYPPYLPHYAGYFLIPITIKAFRGEQEPDDPDLEQYELLVNPMEAFWANPVGVSPTDGRPHLSTDGWGRVCWSLSWASAGPPVAFVVPAIDALYGDSHGGAGREFVYVKSWSGESTIDWEVEISRVAES